MKSKNNNPLERYKTIMAILSDPVNYAIAQREVLNNRKSIITPPIQKQDGGYAFVRALDWPVRNEEDMDSLAEVFETPEGWVIFFDGRELEPIVTLREALDKAKSLITERGHTVIEEIPWDPNFSG